MPGWLGAYTVHNYILFMQTMLTLLQLERDVTQQRIAQRIYDYIYKNWVQPYPVVDDILIENADPQPFPLFGNLTQLL